jgi:hypothetical protein
MPDAPIAAAMDGVIEKIGENIDRETWKPTRGLTAFSAAGYTYVAIPR